MARKREGFRGWVGRSEIFLLQLSCNAVMLKDRKVGNGWGCWFSVLFTLGVLLLVS